MLAPIVGSIVAFAMAAYSWYKFTGMGDPKPTIMDKLKGLWTPKQTPGERFGLQRLEVYLILALVIIQALLPMLNIQPNFVIGLILCVALTMLVIHGIWIWERVAHWSRFTLCFSSFVVVCLSFALFVGPLKMQWWREHTPIAHRDLPPTKAPEPQAPEIFVLADWLDPLVTFRKELSSDLSIIVMGGAVPIDDVDLYIQKIDKFTPNPNQLLLHRMFGCWSLENPDQKTWPWPLQFVVGERAKYFPHPKSTHIYARTIKSTWVIFDHYKFELTGDLKEYRIQISTRYEMYAEELLFDRCQDKRTKQWRQHVRLFKYGRGGSGQATFYGHYEH
jgi:hypothetical protein